MPDAYKEILVALRGGLNTALDPSVVGDDQLTESNGMEYRPPRLGLYGTGGRTQANTATIPGAKIYGLVYASWDGAPADGYLVAFNSPSGVNHAYIGSAEADGDIVFNSIGVGSIPAGHTWYPAVSATAFADGCHFLNDWFFYNGAKKNLAVFSNVITSVGAGLTSWRQHGLIAITATAQTIATGTGSTLAAGVYDVWYVEQSISSFVGPPDDRTSARSSYNGDPVSVTLSASGMQIKVTLPNEINDSVISGYVYASLPNGSYPIGYLIGSGSMPGDAYCTSQDLTDPYEVVAPIGGVPVSAWDEPPIAYSMRVFKDSLVCIDADDRQLIRFSLPGDGIHFPSINYIPVGETAWQDELNALETVNDVLLAFSNFYMFRINYLPRHTDSDDILAARGNCFDTISHGHGAVSPRGTAAFAVAGGAELCLFVCRCLGVHITDGERVSYANIDVDLTTLVDLASIGRTVLKNNPKRHRVEFYYLDKTDTTKAKRLDFYYHPALMQKGVLGFPKLPILGPTPVPGLCPALGLFANDWQMWCGDENAGKVWIEATGTEDGSDQENADGRVTKTWKTKNFYYAGVNGEFDLFKVYTHQSQTSASGSYTVTGEWRTDDVGTSFTATSTVDQSLKGAQQHPAIYGRAQRFSLRGEKADGGAWQELNYLVFVVKSGTELHTAKSS